MSDGGTTVLLTGVGLDGGPDVIRALRADRALQIRVVGVDSDPDAPGGHLCDAFHVAPARQEPGYVDEVARIAEAEGAEVVYPLPTFDQEIFADARERLEGRGLAVPVSPLESVRVCNDKWLFYERLRATSPALVPDTRRALSASDLEEAAGDLGYPSRRVCIRRRTSRGAIGMRILDAGPDRLRAMLEEKPGSPLVSLGEVLDVLGHADKFPEYLVQEYLPGDEWDVDLLCRAGEPRVAVTRRSLAMVGGAASRAVLEPSEHLAAEAGAIAQALELDAVVNVAFREDDEGAPKLLEVNPRIPMSVLSALGGGVNLVALAVRQALGKPAEATEPKTGGRFLLHYRSVVTDGSGRVVVD